jgi:ComF family protein
LSKLRWSQGRFFLRPSITKGINPLLLPRSWAQVSTPIFSRTRISFFFKETLEEDPRFAEFKSAILVPVPLFWRREQWRQGNQAYELSRELSRLSGHETIEAIKRTRPTNTQTKLNRKQRLSNLRDAFRIRKKHASFIAKRKVIIIDDVFTTGATAHECARVLKKMEGPKRSPS